MAMLAFVPAALAGNPHLKGGVKPNPAFFDNGLTLTVTVAYAGLGNFDTLQNVTATADPTATCTNPSGANQPPGQNPAPVDVTGATAVPAGDIKNGNVTIPTTTSPPVTPIVPPVDCTNGQGAWTETITDMTFTSATITLFQDKNADGDFDDAGELVLTVGPCTLTGPTTPPSGSVTGSC